MAPAFVIIGGPVLSHYDHEHPTTVTCTTTTAEARRGKYGGLSILVRTEDCGNLSLRPVSRDETDGIIRDVEHVRVRFSIGEGSLNLLGAFRAVGLWPSVTDYTVLHCAD